MVVMSTKMNTCPECGVNMEGRSPIKHAISHWGEGSVAPDGRILVAQEKNPLVYARIKQLLEMS